jgi:hypothetical protein
VTRFSGGSATASAGGAEPVSASPVTISSSTAASFSTVNTFCVMLPGRTPR